MGLHVIMLVQFIITILASQPSAATTPIAKPGCKDRCGDVIIPYPFGMTKGCYLDDYFLITCDDSFYPPIPFLMKSQINVTKISLQGQLHILQFIARDCYDQLGRSVYNNQPWLKLSKFTISNTQNKFTAVGCDTYAIVRGFQGNERYTTGCMSICDSIDRVSTGGSCSGAGCCQTSIPKGVNLINVTLSSYNNHTYIFGFNPCSYAFVVEQGAFDFSRKSLRDLQNIEKLPVVADWTIGFETCEVAQKNSTSYACKAQNSECYQPPDNTTSGYRCSCLEGYQGNPYLSDGCQDIDECADPSLHKCKKICVNSVGNYSCSCPKGYHGDGTTDGEGCVPNPPNVIKLSVGISIGVTVLLLGSSWLYIVFKKRKLIKEKEKFFRQNGGLMLQQQLLGKEGSTDTLKIFTVEELKKATNNYDARGIIGRGGYGTVYKGELKDHRTVAIKKSKIVDKSLIEQFLNEVVVLSKINHKNVVKFVGCCLETQVPLLVYEFINNGTLFDHIHDKIKAVAISWDIRLRIAAETAGVLSYLHHTASPPIIHGDVKSTNILLDDKYTAKVSDFGASKSGPLDQTQLTTIVQGTLGYLDPEYWRKTQLTEKSDVYSFGVVLAELLTGKRAFSFDRSEEQNLATYFLSSPDDDDGLFHVLEKHLVNEGNTEQLKEVAMLARRCLNVKGEERPAMDEIATELERLRKVEKHPWTKTESNSEELESLLGEKSNVGTSTAKGRYDSSREV